MKQRLSRKRTNLEKALLTSCLFLTLSLPTPFGLLNLILIIASPSLMILQRILHFTLLFYVVKRALTETLYLEFDSDYLYIINHESETKIPLNKICTLELKPKYIGSNDYTRRLRLSYNDDFNSPADIDFYACPGKRLHQFISLVKEKNEGFKFKKWTLL